MQKSKGALFTKYVKKMAASLKYTINISLSIFLENPQDSQFTYQNITISINKSYEVCCWLFNELKRNNFNQKFQLLYCIQSRTEKIRINKYFN